MHPIVLVVPTPFGGIPLYAYGISLGLGLIASWYAARIAARRIGRTRDDDLIAPFLAATLGGVSASLLIAALRGLTRADLGASSFAGEAIAGPLVLLGAILGGVLGCRRSGHDLRDFADAAAPCVALLFFADALGHYLHGSSFGRPLPEGASSLLETLGTFPRWDLAELYEGRHLLATGALGSPAYVDHLERFPDATTHRSSSLPVHPVQLYDAALGALVFSVAMLRARPELPPGRMLWAVTAALALGHLAFDAFRALNGRTILGLMPSQWLVALVAIGSLAALVLSRAYAARSPTTSG